MKKRTLAHASLFSGIGGPEVAAAMLGWRNLFHCEINPFGKAVLDYWFPNSESYEDITKTDFRKWRGKVDVLTGGFPCQPFSYAGHRGGAADARYLWPEMLRSIDEIRPAWVVGENVAGITTMVEGGLLTEVGRHPSMFEAGDDLHEYLNEQTFTLERICSDLERLGYTVQPVLIPAAAVGAPHRRDRIFILAADAYRGVSLRGAGKDESESEGERIPERDTLQRSGVAAYVRSKSERIMADTSNAGLEATRPEKPTARTPRSGSQSMESGTSANTDLQRRNQPVSAEIASETKRQHNEETGRWRDGSLNPERRWAAFPTVSPVHRGNDGLSFSLDDLTISPGKWRTESLKAYGNAIVPQVMYEIFRAIQEAEKAV